MPLEKVIDQHEKLPIFSSRPVDSSKKEIARHKKNLSEINLKVLKNTSSLVSINNRTLIAPFEKLTFGRELPKKFRVSSKKLLGVSVKKLDYKTLDNSYIN